jgi:hypothetical protein
MNYETKFILVLIAIIVIVLLILWYTGFFKKEKNTAVGGNISGFSDAVGHYNQLVGVTNTPEVNGCALLPDNAGLASAAIAADPPQNPCLDASMNTNTSYKTLLKGSYKVDITNSFVSQGGQTSLIEESGIYCCQDAAKAAEQDTALLDNFKRRKQHALRMKEAANASTRAANSVR